MITPKGIHLRCDAGSRGEIVTGMPPKLPELICSDLSASLNFYGLLRFEIGDERPDERFVYLVRGGAALMLEQPLAHDRLFPRAELNYPYGRGVNLWIGVDDVKAVLPQSSPLIVSCFWR